MALRLLQRRVALSARPAFPLVRQQQQRRWATGEVSQQPGSKSFKELKDNAQHEAKKVGGSVAEAIAGANQATSQHGTGDRKASDAISSDLASMTSLAQDVPRDAALFGTAGILPYLGTCGTTIYLSRQATLAQTVGAESGLDAETSLALLHHVGMLQVQYGAILLSFLGALHWGMEFSKYGGLQGRPRYLLGIAPVVAGWSTLLLPGGVEGALVGQWVAFAGMWYADQRATTWGWTPKWYSTYRFWLTSVVGGSILLTLAGANYFGPGEAKLATNRTRLAAAKAATGPGAITGKEHVEGEFKIAPADEAFVKFSNVEKEKEKEEKEEKERQEKEKKEKAEKAKKDETARRKQREAEQAKN